MSSWHALLWPTIIASIAGIIAWWTLRRRGGLLAVGGSVRLAQIIPLGPRERLIVVEAHGESLLIGVTPAQIQIVHKLNNDNIKLNNEGDRMVINPH